MTRRLAIDGGKPVRDRLLPYGRQWVDEEDIAAVVDVLRSDWLTTGPKVSEFENALAKTVGASEAVAVSSGTAGLHATMHAAGIRSGDEVIVPAMTFAATANCVVFQGGTPVFADVNSETLLLDPAQVEQKITPRTKAIVAVDYSGQPCDYDALGPIAERHGLILVADACHSLGGRYKERPVGSLADMTAFSFHPVKHITTGEGGAVVTNDSEFGVRMRRFRNHGITTDHRQRAEQGTWDYEMVDLGYNYRISDFQCALGLSQLGKLPGWIARRLEIADLYDRAFEAVKALKPLQVSRDCFHVYHLYVLRFLGDWFKERRHTIFTALRAEGIGVNRHYTPVHLHPFYRQHFGTAPGLCPVAETASPEILSLPIFPRMTDADVNDVVDAVCKVVDALAALGKP